MIVKYVQNNECVSLSKFSIYIKNYIEILYLYNIYICIYIYIYIYMYCNGLPCFFKKQKYEITKKS